MRFSLEVAFEMLVHNEKLWKVLGWASAMNHCPEISPQSAEVLFVVLLWASGFVLSKMSASNSFVLCFEWQVSFEHHQHSLLWVGWHLNLCIHFHQMEELTLQKISTIRIQTTNQSLLFICNYDQIEYLSDWKIVIYTSPK